MTMEAGTDLSLLQPPAPTPTEEICNCAGLKPIKLMQALGYNPLHCLDCNLEIEPHIFALSAVTVQSIASWRSLHAAMDTLWLDSREYESWAKEQLANISSPVNVRGLALREELNRVRQCYYWWFQDQSEDFFEPAKQCPLCNGQFRSYCAGIFEQFICDRCSMVTVGMTT